MNALDRMSIQHSLRSVSKELAAIGGANTPEMKAAGSALASSMRKQLATRGSLFQGPHRASKTGRASKLRGLPSQPGEPPHRISGRLSKSIGQAVVGGVRRVGSGYFVARLLEEGVDVAEHRRATLAQGLAQGRARRRQTKRRQAQLVIAARPFMARALDAALPKMGDVFVGALQHRGQS